MGGLTVDVTSAPTRPWHRLRLCPGVIGIVIMAVLLVVAVLAWLGVTPYDPIAQDAPNRLQRPSGAHWFGTDQLGECRGLLPGSQTRCSSPGWPSRCRPRSARLRELSRATSVGLPMPSPVEWPTFFAFPPLLLALTLVSVLDRTWFTVALAIAVVYVPIFFRVARGPVLSLREQDFVRAAVSTGQNPWATMALHVLPNISGLIIVQTALSLSWAVLTEASLSFLGLGAPPPAPSLGSMIFEARNVISIANWTMIAPGIVVVLLVAGLNLLGDGLRDAFDVKGRD